LNICCNVACLTFHLPHITTVSFQSHHATHSRLFGGMQHPMSSLQLDENVVHFTRLTA